MAAVTGSVSIPLRLKYPTLVGFPVYPFDQCSAIWWPPCQLLHIYQIAKAPVISRGLFAREIYARLKIGGHLVGISRLSTSAIFRNLLDLALKTWSR